MLTDSQTLRIRCLELASEASAYTVDLSRAGSVADFIAFAGKIEAFVRGDDRIVVARGEISGLPPQEPLESDTDYAARLAASLGVGAEFVGPTAGDAGWIDWAGGDIPVVVQP